MHSREISAPRQEAAPAALLKQCRSGHMRGEDFQYQSRRSRSSLASMDQPLCGTQLQDQRFTPRTPVVRRHAHFSTMRGQDGTEVRICVDRFQRRRETQAPGLAFSLFDMRNDIFFSNEKDGQHDGLKPVKEEPVTSRDSAGSSSPRLRQRAMTQDVRYEMLQMADSSGRVQVERLGHHGFTTEDLSRVIYDKFRDQDLPDFLDYIGLERKGGLDRIQEVWSPEKYFWFFFLIGSVLFNISYLLAMDWVIFGAFTKELLTEAQSLDLRNATQAVGSLLENNAQTVDIAKHVKDSQIRWWLLNVAAVVATWEVCWVCVKILHTAYIWWIFCFGGSEYKSFHAVMYFFQKLLPQCSTFSAIKLMARVHPSLIYNEYLYFVFESSWRATWSGFIMVSAYFFLKCVACAMAALGAFTIKVLAVGMKVMNPQYSVLYRIGSIAALMNQCMGCVIMEVVLQDRLFLFVFGGQEAMYQDRGIAYKNVYECRMAKQIWDEFWEKGRKLKAIVLFATFDHYDLQKLLLESTPEDYYNMDIGLGVDSPSESLIPINEAALDSEMGEVVEEEEGEEDDYDIVGPRARFLEEKKLPQAASLSRERSGASSLNGAPRERTGVTFADEEEDKGRAREFSFAPGTPEHELGQAVVPKHSFVVGPLTSHLEPDAASVRSESFASSCGSLGMRAMTSTLEHESGWRDAL